jgi:hypothetical protein
MPRPVSTPIAAAAAEQGALLDLLAVERGRYRFGRRAEGSTGRLGHCHGAHLMYYSTGQEVTFANAIDAATTFIGGRQKSFRKCDPSGSLSNLRLAVPFDFVALRAA